MFDSARGGTTQMIALKKRIAADVAIENELMLDRARQPSEFL
jgi:hypothetical protein